MSTQQEIIKQFMAALDTTSKSGTAAVDEAINLATNGKFKTTQEVINQMVSDCNSAAGADKFLSDYCGIILDNSDTGAITGKDAGGSAIKTAENIVPESGSLINFTGNSFTVNGLTVQLASMSSSYTLTDLNYSDLTDSAQRYIWQALYSWWVSGALNLIAQSYGDNFSFTSSSSASVKKIYICFTNENNGSTAATMHWMSSGVASQLALMINMNYYGNLSSGDVNGSSNYGGYLDRTLAHEFTHAVMAANVGYFSNLPTFIKEGLAELTHGVDDTRISDIRALANDSSSLSNALSLSSSTSYTSSTFAGGYMFLRYLAKQSAEEDAVGVTLNNYTDGVTLTGGAGNDTIKNEGDNVYIEAGAGNDSLYNPDGDDLTIDAGAGNDTVTGYYWSSKISAGTGSDCISILTGSSNTIDGGDDADTIYTYSHYSSINGGAGNDRISLYSDIWSDGTVKGGTGNDTIYGNSLSAYGVLYQYASGDGNDIIYGFTTADTLHITSGSYSTMTSGNDFIVSVGSGSVVLKNIFDNYHKVHVKNSSGTVAIYNDVKARYGTSGSDTLINPGNNASVAVYGQAGNDTLYNSASYVTLSGGDGADSIYNSASYVTIDGGAGADTILNYYSYSSINGGADADRISLYNGWSGNGKNTIVGGTGNDTIWLSSTTTLGNVYVYQSGDGSDLIHNVTNYDTIYSGESYSTIISGNNVIVSVGSGAMTLVGASGKSFKLLPLPGSIITNYTKYSTVKGTASADTIENYAGGVYISAGGGNDSILTNTSYNYTINSSYGYVTIDGGAGNDTIHSNDPYVSISGGDGNDSIYISGSGSNTINGSAGDDIISLFSYSSGSNIILYGGEGNDTLYGVSAYDTISITSGTYSTLKSGSNYALKVGSGAMTFSGVTVASALPKIIGTYKDDAVGVTLSNSTDKATLGGGAGNDSIYNSGASVKIYAGAGNDTVYNYNGYYSYIELGAGNDSLYGHYNNYVTVDAGHGNDTIIGNYFVSRISAGAGSDYISVASSSTIDGGDDTDTICADSGSINGGAGSDRISLRSSYAYGGCTVLGGTGNDTIYGNSLSMYGNLYQYASGDGNDTIYGFTTADTLHITSGSYTTTKSGNDFIVSVGSGSVVLKNIFDNYHKVHVKNSSGTVAIYNDVKARYGTSGNDFITNPQNNSSVAVYGQAGNDTLYNYSASNVTLSGGDGNDSIYNSASYVTIDGGAGADTVSNYYSYSSINGGADADKISLASGGSGYGGNTVLGGTGNDTIWLNSATTLGNVYVYNSGDGFDRIYNVSNYDTISIGGGSYSTATTSGGDVIISVGEGAMTLVGASSKSFKIIGESVPADTIPAGISISGATLTASTKFTGSSIDLADYASTVTKVNASALSRGISIAGTSAANSIKGGSGADTISGGAGNDTVSLGAGNDVYIYSGGNDVIQGYAAGDSISLASGSVSAYSISGSDAVFKIGSNTLKVKSGKGKEIVVDGVVYPTVDSKNVTLTSAANSATISDDNATVYALAGNDTLKISGNAGYFDGGAGNDKISLGGDAEFNTIIAGTGNDTIYSNGRGNIFAYNAGDGNDVIYNYSEADSIAVRDIMVAPGGVPWATLSNGDNVIVNIDDGGKITLVGANGRLLNLFPKSSTPPYKFSKGGDRYTNNIANTILSALSGNDSIYNVTNYVTISGDEGYDSIISNGRNCSISGGAGHDRISLGSSATGNTLIGGAGNDTIYSSGKGNIFLYEAGDGNDTISGSSANDTLKITGGTYTLSGSTVSVYSGDSTVASGKIIFKNTAPKIDGTPVQILEYPKSLTSAADTLTVSDDEATVYALAGNDVLKISGNAGYFDGGAGTDKLSLGSSASNVTITGGAGNDTIYSSGKGNIFLYDAGDGNDSITGSSANDTLKITGGTYTLSGSTVSVYSGDSTVASGRIIFKNTAPQIIGTPVPVPEYPKSLTSAADTLTVSDDNATVYALAGNDVLKISGNAGYFDGGAGTDKLSLGSNAQAVTIYGGAGNDTIYSSGKGNIFLYKAGDGNDSISGSSANDTLKITGGTYTLSGSTVSVYSGDSTVASGRIIFKNTAPQIIGSLKPEPDTETGVVTLTKNSDTHTNTVPGATISALAGADNIKNSANDVSISGEAGNDIISLGAAATNVTINGGAGNDKIYTNGNGNFIEYASGDGNDIIYGFAGEDLIQILSGTPIFAQSNADAIITVGKNSITLKNVDSDELSLDDNNKISLNKIIELTLKYNKNLVELPYERAIIHGSTSNDNYVNLGNNVTLDGAAGNDTICNNQNDISISGAAGNDVISLGSSAQNVTIHGGAGADEIYTNGKNNSIQYDAGKDTVHGFGGSDSIQIAGTIKDSQQSGENVIVTVGSSSNILKIIGVNIGDLKYEDGAITYDINEISLTSGDDTKTIDEDKSRVHALGGNDVITNTANEVTIYGGAGKDKITSNGRSTCLDGGEGNDTIRLGEDSEMATITGGAGNDSISVSGGANLFIYEEGDGNDTIVGFSKGDSISVSAEKISEPLKNSNVTFEIGAGKIVLRDVADEEFTVENNIIMLKDVSRRQTIPGTDKADPLENNAVGVIIDALGGIDTINNSGGSVTIYGGAGNDKIFNAGNEAYIDGGAGADLISLASGVESATIFGGAGNDTIYSSGNGTLIQYGTGGSKDVIVGFGGSDSIEIVSGTIRNYKADGDDVKVTVGTGTTNVLTLKDFALGNFHVEGNLIYSSGRSGSNGLFFDDNFIGGDTQLDSIVEKNFAVTNLDADNFENLAQEKSLITFGEK